MTKSPQRLEAELLAANLRFYEAFEMLNLEAMDSVWADAPAVSVIHPGSGPIHGREAVMKSWGAIFEGTQEIVFELDQVEISIVGTAGWVTLIEHIEQRNDGQLTRASALATNVFVHGLSGWRIVHHHASPIARVRPKAPPPAKSSDPHTMN
jgi:ketosteroid isomerase-like protein